MTMLEKVEDALHASLSAFDPIERDHPSWRIMARAALEAMRDPDDAMRDAMIELCLSNDKEDQATRVGYVWIGYKAAISAALNEKPE